MKRVLRIVMVMLSYAPLATVAIAAHAKANELDGEAQNERVRASVTGARYRLLPTFHMSSTIDDARIRYAQVTGLEGEELESSMARDINALADAGLLQFNEKYLVAGGPSEHASGGVSRAR